MSRAHPYIPIGCDQQGRLHSGCDADPCMRGQIACPLAGACLTPEPSNPRERLGLVGSITRWLLANKQRGQMVLVLGCVVLGYLFAKN